MIEIGIYILLLLFNIVVLFKTFNFPEITWEPMGPGVFPQIIIVSLIILLSILIIKKIIKRKAEDKPIIKKTFSLKSINKLLKKYNEVWGTIFLFLAYIVSMKFIGFKFSTFGFLLITQWILSPKKKSLLPSMIIISLVISFGFSYFFESFLSVIFPRGIFF